MPKFPVFTRSGEVTVSIDLLDRAKMLSTEELTRLSDFHHFVFSKVLRLEKDPMAFHQAKAESSYIIIPFLKSMNSLQTTTNKILFTIAGMRL